MKKHSKSRIQESYLLYFDWLKGNIKEWHHGISWYYSAFKGKNVTTPFTKEIALFCENGENNFEQWLNKQTEIRKAIASVSIKSCLFSKDFRYYTRKKYSEILFPEFQKLEKSKFSRLIEKDFTILNLVIEQVIIKIHYEFKYQFVLDEPKKKEILNDCNLSLFYDRSSFSGKKQFLDPFYFFNKVIKERVKDVFDEMIHNKEFPSDKIEEVKDDTIVEVGKEDELLSKKRLVGYQIMDSLKDPIVFVEILKYCPFGGKMDRQTKYLTLFLLREKLFSGKQLTEKAEKSFYSLIIDEVRGYVHTEIPYVEEFINHNLDDDKTADSLRRKLSYYGRIAMFGLLRYFKDLFSTDDKYLIEFIGTVNHFFIFQQKEITSDEIKKHYEDEEIDGLIKTSIQIIFNFTT